MKGNVIQLNTLHLNSVRLNGIGKVQSVSLKGGSTEDPVFPPVEPPIEPEPTPTYTLSASVTNGMVSAKRNGSAVNLPYTANEGDTIVVEVTPNDGYAFEGWNDGNTDNPRTITMNADVALSAECSEVVQPPVGNYIQFEDAEVERVLMSKGVSSDGVGITMEDAAAVTSIEEWFNGNSAIISFNELQYFTGVTRLYYAFRNCNSLKSVRLSPNTTIIGERAFANATSLNSINLDKVTTIDYAAFYGTTSLRIKLNCPSLSSIGAAAFYGSGLEEIVSLGNALTISSAQAGSNYGVFADCPNLKIANISSVKTIGSKAFRYSPLETIDISSAQVINDRAFAYCDLSRVEIGKDVTSIAEYALYENPLKEAIVRATTPPSLGGNVFANTASTLVIYVPDASLEAYKGATNWINFASRIKPLSEYLDE
jgi:hypothetical protein